MLRGRPIRFEAGQWVFVDTGLPTVSTWRERTCGACERPNRADGHDACIGVLPHVRNACCGHGSPSEAYVQFDDGSVLRGALALRHFYLAKRA